MISFDLKVKVAVWAFIGLLWAFALLALLGVRSLHKNLEGIPVLLEEVRHEINWMRL